MNVIFTSFEAQRKILTLVEVLLSVRRDLFLETITCDFGKIPIVFRSIFPRSDDSYLVRSGPHLVVAHMITLRPRHLHIT